MFTKEERLFIWKKVYEMIDRLEDGEYICVALRNVVFMYFKTHKNIYEFRSDEMVPILQQQRCLYRKVRSIYSKTFTRQRPTNYIIMSWINSDGRGVIRNISQKQNYARC